MSKLKLIKVVKSPANKLMKKNKKNNQGQLIIESSIALSILIIGFLAIVTLLTRSLAANQNAVNRLIAAHLAEEGIEVVKNIIDTNIVKKTIDSTIAWNEGLPAGEYEAAFDSNSLSPNLSRFLLLDKNSGFYNYSSGDQTTLKRTIEISNISSDEIRVIATVSWTTRALVSTISVEDHFFNWRQ